MNEIIDDQMAFRFTPELPEDRKLSIGDRFFRYHAANPNVYDALCGLARQCRSKNRSRVIGIQMLFEVLRWNYYLSVDGDEEFKFPNEFAAGYARLIMKQEPDLDGIFRLCKSEFDEILPR
jgi:hypothetical protein